MPSYSQHDPSNQPLLDESIRTAPGSSYSVSSNILGLRRGTFKAEYYRSQRQIQNFLSSHTQHYCVLALVTLDLLGIFADIFIALYTCEQLEDPGKQWDDARNGLSIAGLVFSCLFMLELLMSIWAFGWR